MTKILAVLISAFLWTSAFASDVYIEQAGTTATVDITQTGSDNTVGSSITPTVIDGDSFNLDITQTGILNTVDIATTTATSTVLDYTVTGDSNTLVVDINGGTGNSLTAVVTGDTNAITMCGTKDGNGGCSAGVSVNSTANIVNITGDTNSVNLELASASAVNTINIGQINTSVGNTVNVTQTNNDLNTVSLSVDGSTNTVNVIQN
jgi:hypothetical protein|tara:strand:+ start:1561 stop:2178 length:618 start_codon:yes stop_codon:yes gene_type:complete